MEQVDTELECERAAVDVLIGASISYSNDDKTGWLDLTLVLRGRIGAATFSQPHKKRKKHITEVPPQTTLCGGNSVGGLLPLVLGASLLLLVFGDLLRSLLTLLLLDESLMFPSLLLGHLC
jgi:hypothetical protein